MKIAFLMAVAILVVATATYDKWSYRSFHKRSEVNAKHPDWTPYCGINFLEKDPQWFVENGYGKYVRQ